MNEKQTVKSAVFAMLENLPALMEHAKLDAKLKRAQFVALTKEGFSEAQAIELLRPRG